MASPTRWTWVVFSLSLAPCIHAQRKIHVKTSGHVTWKRAFIRNWPVPKPWSWTSQFPELWENLYYLSHPVYGILLWQPKQIKIRIITFTCVIFCQYFLLVCHLSSDFIMVVFFSHAVLFCFECSREMSIILGWPKSSFGFFHQMLQKKLKDLFGQPSNNLFR